MAEEQLDYGDEEFGGSQKMPYHGDGAIPALADDEIGGEDDEYDDLYNDVNVGEGFLQMQRSESLPSANVGNGGFHDQKVNIQETLPESMVSQDMNIPGVATENVYPSSGLRLQDNKEGMTVDLMQKRMVPQVTNDTGFRGSIPVPQKPPVDPVSMSGTVTNDPPPMMNSNAGHGQGVPQMMGSQMGANNVNMARPIVNENQARPSVENGATTLFVGELHWWTTDAELENVLSQYGRVKEIKFFDERASGKSKGYCQVEFFESGSAAACKDGMNGYVFNGRPCVVAFASPQTIRQMGASYANKNQGPAQSQPEPQGRRSMNDGAGRGGGNNFSGGDGGRNSGRGNNWGRGGGGQGFMNRGGGHMRGRGAMGPKNVNTPGFGSGPAAGAYGQGLGGPGFGAPLGGFMHPQGMMGGGFDPTYMGRGAGYGGFPGSGFPGIMPQFPGVNTMGLAGVAPHVNPAFFGRGMGAGGMGMMGTSGMEGPQGAMWGDTNMGGWGGGEEHGQRTRESSYGGEDGGSEYGYGGEASHEKGARPNVVSRQKERGAERVSSGNSEKRHRDDRDQDRERYDKDYKYKEEKENYRDHRQKERSSGYEDDWDRGQSSTRSRSRSRANPEEDHRSRSRDADYGKRRRMRAE